MRFLRFKALAWVLLCLAIFRAAGNDLPSPSVIASRQAMSWSDLSAQTAASCQEDDLAVIAAPTGAQVRCAFQKLSGAITADGLRLESTIGNHTNDSLRVWATAFGRPSALVALAPTGTVTINRNIASLQRPGVTEEYRVSVEGVRQDFVIAERPMGTGELQVELSVEGATAESLAAGVRLVLQGSGRELHYHQLHVTDANGRELPARMQWLANRSRIVVLVEDAGAVYPVKIDPTFSDANWARMNAGIPGADNTITAAAIDASGNLYVGGSFTVVGTVFANSVAKWNGTNWTALGLGINGPVWALAVSGNTVYAGGAFDVAGEVNAANIAKWDGTNWVDIGGTDAPVRALRFAGTDLYVGGEFSMAGEVEASRIARWSGTVWSAVGSGVNGNINALVNFGTTVYAAGEFTQAGGNAANYVARWSGTDWFAMGAGVNSNVTALAIASGTAIYAGGEFTVAGTTNAIHVARWDGATWSALGSGIPSYIPVYPTVGAMWASGSDLYVGGWFISAGGTAATNLARWNGLTWLNLNAGLSAPSGYAPYVSAMIGSGANIFAGGTFFEAQGKAANCIIKWNGTAWSALGTGMNQMVYALAVVGSDLYAGGEFIMAGETNAKYLARWTGTNWSALGTGVNGPVRALAVSGSDLYVGGDFTTAGGLTVNCIAHWNGTAWSALGSGVGGAVPFLSVATLAISGSTLYAGGMFESAGGTSAKNIARWNGSNWSALGSGLNFSPLCFAVADTNLYAGGMFETAGGNAAKYIARWNGTTWSALGSGMDSPVYALAMFNGELYAGGFIATAGGVEVSSIARWNGSSWSAVGAGVNLFVSSLMASGTNLYVGGFFTLAGDNPAMSIARWNGSEWSTLGSGVTGQVLAMTIAGPELYVGGNFSAAGGKVSPFIARAYLPALPTLTVRRTGSDVVVSWPVTDTAGFSLEYTSLLTNATATVWLTNTVSVIDNAATRSVTLPLINAARHFRLRKP